MKEPLERQCQGQQSVERVLEGEVGHGGMENIMWVKCHCGLWILSEGVNFLQMQLQIIGPFPCDLFSFEKTFLLKYHIEAVTYMTFQVKEILLRFYLHFVFMSNICQK